MPRRLHPLQGRPLRNRDPAVPSVLCGIGILRSLLLIGVHKGCHGDDLPGALRLIVADKRAVDGRIHGIVHGRLCAHVLGVLAGGHAVRPCLFLLLLHGGVEAVFVHGHSVLAEDVLGVVEREAVGVIELEGIVSGENGSAVLLQVFHHAGEDVHALLVGLLEGVLLGLDDLEDELPSLLQLRIAVLRGVDDVLGQCRKEGSLDAQLVAVADSSADDAAEHISSAVVRGHDAVGDHEGHGPGVIRADSDRDVRVIGALLLVPDAACHLADEIA